MAESIITLGIGGTPDNLTPFITSGLLIGAVIEISTSGKNAVFVNLNDSAIYLERQDNTVFIKQKDKEIVI